MLYIKWIITLMYLNPYNIFLVRHQQGMTGYGIDDNCVHSFIFIKLCEPGWAP